jgi:hypothetical protein
MPTTDIATRLVFMGRLLAAAAAFLLTLGCATESGRVDMIRAVADSPPCTRAFDSVSVVRTALDTVNAAHRMRGMVFESTILRFEPDSAAGLVRVVTTPRPTPGLRDGMAVVLLDCDGRVFDLILTDSV